MKVKIIAVLIMTLLIVATLQVVGTTNNKVLEITPSNKTKPTNMSTPDYFSWKDYEGEDWTTIAKNQFIPNWCGSCWIFAPMGILESVINIREGSAVIDPDLSEQYVLSCLPEAGYGCNGGMPYDALYYIADTSASGNNCNGVIWEECFPYQANDDIPCDDKCPDWEDCLVPISDHGHWISDESPDGIEAIKIQIMQGGPVVACMLYNNDFYSWGLDHHSPDDYFPYEDEHGDDHDIIVLGWKDDISIPNGGYWITKNSFGTDFGYDGFNNIEYGLLGSLWIDGDPNTTYIVWVDYDPESFCWPNEPGTPYQPTITGEKNGIIETEYEYTFNAEDPDGDNVRYHIDWGDGNSETTDFFSSGTDVKVKHIWDKPGTYAIKAKAEDTNGKIGPEGILSVSMPRNRAINRSFLNFLENYPNLFLILQKILHRFER